MREFEGMLVGKFDFDILQDIIEWIKDYIEIGEIYSDTEIKEHVNDTYAPEDMFNEEDLSIWAKENGFKEA